MKINHENCCFYIGTTQVYADAKLVYEPVSNGIIAATHTFVGEEWRGKGVAALLLDCLCDYARMENLRIIAKCNYVHHQFSKHPDKYRDVSI